MDKEKEEVKIEVVRSPEHDEEEFPAGKEVVWSDPERGLKITAEYVEEEKNEL